MSRERRTVTLHVGTPKSGTTSLQSILAHNRGLLLEHGHLYPGKQRAAHFIEAMSVRESGFRGQTFETTEGAWDRVVAEILAHDGPSLLSHEILGGSTPKVIQRVVTSFGDRPVRIVITCRDLGRQLPAVWQEGVKNGDTLTYDAFLAEALDGWGGVGTVAGMWRGQNLAGLGARWGEAAGTENVRFVTVPPAGADHDVLWQRFRAAVGLPEVAYAIPRGRHNPSLGTVETELLRRIVERLPEDTPGPTFSRQVKRRLAQRQLVKHSAGGTLTVPRERRVATDAVATAIAEGLHDGGYPVVGDLGDLRPTHREDGTLPDEVGADQLLDRALEILVPLVLHDTPRKGGPRSD